MKKKCIFANQNYMANRTELLVIRCLLVILMAGCAVSCTKDTPFTEITGHTGLKGDDPNPEPGVRLGRRLPNAYSLTNMQAAYNILHQGSSHSVSSQEDNLTPTHLYLSIKVNDTLTLTHLLEDTTIDVFPYPLDYELIGSGEYEPEDPYTVYAVVPINWNISDFNVNIIEQCVIPDDDDEEMQEVERKALQMAGYTLVGGDKSWGQCPDGYIKVWNTRTESLEGVRDIKLKMNVLVKVRNVYTSANGHYHSNSKFYVNVNYTAFFDNRQGFRIWDNTICILPAMFCLGTHAPSGYNYSFWRTSKGWRIATTNNGVCAYNQMLNDGLEITAPPSDMRISVMSLNTSSGDGEWLGSTPMFYHRIRNDATYAQFMAMFCISGGLILALPDMFIFNNDISTVSQYATIFHEFSHVSHYAQVGGNYWSLLVGDEIVGVGYGDTNSSWLSQRVGVSEMWGYYAGNALQYHYWLTQHNDIIISHHGDDQWFRPQILRYMEDTIPEISLLTIFGCLTDSIYEFNSFENSLKNIVSPQYHEYIETLFDSIPY